MLLFADNVSFTEFEMPGLPLTDYIIYCCASYRLFLSESKYNVFILGSNLHLETGRVLAKNGIFDCMKVHKPCQLQSSIKYLHKFEWNH